MPHERQWKAFFEVEKILKAMELNDSIIDVAEFGSGYGTFTISASKVIKGKIYAIDIEQELIKRVIERARMKI